MGSIEDAAVDLGSIGLSDIEIDDCNGVRSCCDCSGKKFFDLALD